MTIYEAARPEVEFEYFDGRFFLAFRPVEWWESRGGRETLTQDRGPRVGRSDTSLEQRNGQQARLVG